MKLKGIKKLEKYITSILATEVYEDLDKAKLNTEFLAEYWRDRIYFSPFISERADCAMREVVKKQFNFNIPADGMFLFSCLHEIGHCNTMSVFNADEIELFQDIIKYGIKERPADEWNYTYYSVPQEYLANQWAVNWCREVGVEKFEAVNDELIKQLQLFYDKNGVV